MRLIEKDLIVKLIAGMADAAGEALAVAVLSHLGSFIMVGTSSNQIPEIDHPATVGKGKQKGIFHWINLSIATHRKIFQIIKFVINCIRSTSERNVVSSQSTTRPT